MTLIAQCSLLSTLLSIPLTRFKATWNGTNVCNDANLYCTFSSRRQITKRAQYLASSPISQFVSFMVFDVLMPQAVCKTFLKEILSKRHNTVEFLCVAYFNSLSILTDSQFGSSLKAEVSSFYVHHIPV